MICRSIEWEYGTKRSQEGRSCIRGLRGVVSFIFGGIYNQEEIRKDWPKRGLFKILDLREMKEGRKEGRTDFRSNIIAHPSSSRTHWHPTQHTALVHARAFVECCKASVLFSAFQ